MSLATLNKLEHHCHIYKSYVVPMSSSDNLTLVHFYDIQQAKLSSNFCVCTQNIDMFLVMWNSQPET